MATAGTRQIGGRDPNDTKTIDVEEAIAAKAAEPKRRGRKPLIRTDAEKAAAAEQARKAARERQQRRREKLRRDGHAENPDEVAALRQRIALLEAENASLRVTAKGRRKIDPPLVRDALAEAIARLTLLSDAERASIANTAVGMAREAAIGAYNAMERYVGHMDTVEEFGGRMREILRILERADHLLDEVAGRRRRGLDACGWDIGGNVARAASMWRDGRIDRRRLTEMCLEAAAALEAIECRETAEEIRIILEDATDTNRLAIAVQRIEAICRDAF